jgi:MtfA peptidase
MIPLILLIAVVAFGFYFFISQSKKKKRGIAVNDINRALLSEHVLFYQQLDANQKVQFESDILQFLSQTAVTGVGTKVEELDRLLVASAAVIPLFFFEKWRYHNLQEVLVYADAFNMDYESAGHNNDRNIQGMVGTGAMEGKMLISKHSLRQGFSNQSDKHNTAIHEFVHLIDKWDGDTDGVPETLLDKQYVLPWIDLIHEEMKKIAKGDSAINTYALTNKAEFFAVASEYFFERPDLFKEKHPELYQMLSAIFDVPDK